MNAVRKFITSIDELHMEEPIAVATLKTSLASWAGNTMRASRGCFIETVFVGALRMGGEDAKTLVRDQLDALCTSIDGVSEADIQPALLLAARALLG